jgi:hypothetical protein
LLPTYKVKVIDLLLTPSPFHPLTPSPFPFPVSVARYNADMSFDKLAEAKIKEAMESGEFDNLAGRGKPLDLSAYFNTPEDVRLAYSILKNADVVPREAELLKEAEALREKLVCCASEDERAKIKKQIDEMLLKYNLLVEHSQKKKRQ